jgi:hypothetical protein
VIPIAATIALSAAIGIAAEASRPVAPHAGR